MGRLYTYFITVTVCLIIMGKSVETGDKENHSNKTLNGKTLFDLGNIYKKPMLRMIGKSLMNLECKTSPCSDWSEWSACKLFVGQFGAKSRTRTCGGTATNGCQSMGEPTTESESFICQEFCPSNYELVHGKFCLRYYNVSKQDKKNAESSCSADGGYLININSPEKWLAFAFIFKKYKSNSGLYIDGQRKDVSSPWTYSYESDITGYSYWYPSNPSNGSNELCKGAYISSSEGVYDDPCSNQRFFLCELIPK